MLLRQGTERIEVVVRKEGGGSVKGANETSADEKTAGGGQSAESVKQNRFTKTVLKHSFSASKQLVNTAADFWATGIGYQYGDQALQDRTQRVIEQVRDVENTAISVAMGATGFAWAGVPGIVFGALAGAVQSLSSIGFRQARREREFDFKMFKETSSVEYARARAYINLTTGRLR